MRQQWTERRRPATRVAMHATYAVLAATIIACSSEVLAPDPAAPPAPSDSVALLIAGLDSVAADVTRQIEELRPTTQPRDRIAQLERYRGELRDRAAALRARAPAGMAPPSFDVEYDPDDPGLGVTRPEEKTDVNLAQLRLDVASAWVLPAILSHETSLATNIGGLAFTYHYRYKPTSTIPLWYLPYSWPLSSRLNCLNDDTAADAQTSHWWEATIKGKGSQLRGSHTEDFDSCQWKPEHVSVNLGRLQLAKGQSTSIDVVVKKFNGEYVSDCPIRYASMPAGTLSVGRGTLTAVESGPMYVYVVATCRGVYDSETVQILEDCSLDQSVAPLPSCSPDGSDGAGTSVPYDPPPPPSATYVCWPVYRWTYLYFPDYPEKSTWTFEYIGETCQWQATRVTPPEALPNAVAPAGDSTVVPRHGRPRLVRLVAESALPDGAPIALVPSFERGEDLILVGPNATRFDLAVALSRADSAFATAPKVSNHAEVLGAAVPEHADTRHTAIASAMLRDLREAGPATRGRLAGRTSIVVALPDRARGRKH